MRKNRDLVSVDLASVVESVATGGHARDRSRQIAEALYARLPGPHKGVDVAVLRGLGVADHLAAVIDAGGNLVRTFASQIAKVNRRAVTLPEHGVSPGDPHRWLGESLTTVDQYDTPLAEATTPSLEALRAYSAGWKATSSKGLPAALPFFKHAIELDPKFAMAYAGLGRMYGDTGEPDLSAENTGQAYQLRDRIPILKQAKVEYAKLS